LTAKKRQTERVAEALQGCHADATIGIVGRNARLQARQKVADQAVRHATAHIAKSVSEFATSFISKSKENYLKQTFSTKSLIQNLLTTFFIPICYVNFKSK
jgi:hypothetical protein